MGTGLFRAKRGASGFELLTAPQTFALNCGTSPVSFATTLLLAMRQLPFAILILGFTSTAIFAAKDDPSTALGAIKALPRGEWKKIARIEARDGTPTPERWHIIVHDPKDENGLHEYVVAGG